MASSDRVGRVLWAGHYGFVLTPLADERSWIAIHNSGDAVISNIDITLVNDESDELGITPFGRVMASVTMHADTIDDLIAALQEVKRASTTLSEERVARERAETQ